MNIRSLTLALAFALVAHPCVADTTDRTMIDQQIVIKQIETDQRSLYALNLGLTEQESRKFWPIYDEYESAIKKVTGQRLALLNEFAVKYHQLTDADAESLLTRLWESEQESLRIRQRYARKVQQVLPGVKALRYVQVQARIENALMGKFISMVPLAH